MSISYRMLFEEAHELSHNDERAVKLARAKSTEDPS